MNRQVKLANLCKYNKLVPIYNIEQIATNANADEIKGYHYEHGDFIYKKEVLDQVRRNIK